MKRFFLIENCDYTMGIMADGERLTDFFAVQSGCVLGNVYIGRVENVRGKQCFVSYDKSKKNGILELKGSGYKVGDFVKCQITREENGDKGVILSDRINLAGNFVILSSTVKGYKYSHRLDEKDAGKLKSELTVSKYGFIIRNQAADADLLLLEWEMKELSEKYESILSIDKREILCIYSENNVERLLKEFDLKGAELITNIDEKIEQFDFFVYDGITPILDFYKLRSQFELLFERRVSLKNGIELVFDDTEAMTVIDVNTKSYIGGDDFIANKHAAEEIARQIELRNLSGIIVIDFISMKERREELLVYVNDLLSEGREKAEATGINELSLIAINRKKRYNNFMSLFYENCEKCGGGKQKKNIFICRNLCDELLRLYGMQKFKSILIRLNDNLFSCFAEGKYYEKELLKVLGSSTAVFIEKDNDINEYKLILSNDNGNLKKAIRL